MPSPSGIFAGLSLVELQELRADLILRITQGDRTSLSGAAKSSSKNWAMDPQDALVEVNYSIGILTGTGPNRQTTFNNSGINCRFPATVTFDV